MNKLVDKVLCPKCNREMHGVSWGNMQYDGDWCWQKVTFSCFDCDVEKPMRSVYEWSGFEEDD